MPAFSHVRCLLFLFAFASSRYHIVSSSFCSIHSRRERINERDLSQIDSSSSAEDEGSTFALVNRRINQFQKSNDSHQFREFSSSSVVLLANRGKDRHRNHTCHYFVFLFELTTWRFSPARMSFQSLWFAPTFTSMSAHQTHKRLCSNKEEEIAKRNLPALAA